MGRELAFSMFARVKAGLGFTAAISIALLAIVGSGSALAAPADRGGDAMVLKGIEAGGLIGTQPGKIVAFKWGNGRWVQVPVQVDERHRVDVRQLYPPGDFPPYVGNNDPDFDVEVYADPKTRSGADADTNLDGDDELTFMGSDAGAKAPSGVGSPSGVVRSSGVAVKVDDPVGGGSAFVYLFQSKGLDPSAGKDYVDYDFNLTNLTDGQTLLDDYSYIGGFNPEDSTVKTDNYELHSYDRWMEDEMKITAGNADGTDILDREVAQATLTGCGRSEYTFSGRWLQDTTPGNDNATDNEGTYIAVIDGPVRAIRSYMGANSGPYVQREHIYYADHEQNTVFLRVHVMLDLYSWTDYAPSAIGMTYRDAKNSAGVTVDGTPETLVPTTEEDVANGFYSWQQISGQQGTATTVVGSDTDIPNANFGNYYLDDATPTGGSEVQCGGDGQSIGASGFGILGHNDTPITPNTDPRLGTFNNLTVKRTRYFGPPADGVAEAEDFTARVTKPLAGTSYASPMKAARIGMSTKLLNRKVKARPGKVLKLKIRVTNNANFPTRWAKVCVRSKKFVKGKSCAKVGSLGIGKKRVINLKPKVNRYAKGRKLNFSVSVQSAQGSYRTNSGSSGFSVKIRR